VISPNGVVAALLRSPMRRLLSGSTCLVRYRGRRSGRTFVTPTQYALDGDAVVILVSHHEAKTWWRNFRTPAPIEVLLAGRWRPMVGTAHVLGTGADDPRLAAYLRRFPRARGAIETAGAVVVVVAVDQRLVSTAGASGGSGASVPASASARAPAVTAGSTSPTANEVIDSEP
jgi:hypothetical protein